MFKQLELFEAPVDPDKELQDIRTEWNRVRKALFMQQAELKKKYQELSHDHELLKLNICRGKIVV